MSADSRSIDLSRTYLDGFPEHLLQLQHGLTGRLELLNLSHNRITALPRSIAAFHNLISLEISNNDMKYLSPDICRLKNLESLTARNNLFDNDSLPEELARMSSLKVLNFSGNLLTAFPKQFTKLTGLTALYLGGNQIDVLPQSIGNLTRLEVLYLGGNSLQEVPAEIGKLAQLRSLTLSDNRIQRLPGNALSHLRRLRSLSLHNNQLSLLPPAVATLNLSELSLRENPLVVRFVQELVHEPPSLQELAGRVVKVRGVSYDETTLPKHLIRYLDMACRCVNAKCKGVYFTSRVEHVKFVDFCGKYRIPLLEYLCSPTCSDYPAVYASSSDDSESEDEVEAMMKKVLLG